MQIVVEPSLIISGIILSLIAAIIFFIIGKSQEKNIHTIEDFLIFGKDMSTEDLKWTFYATNISLASIFIALSVTAITMGVSTIWLVVGWVIGLWIFYLFFNTNKIQDFFINKKGKTIFQFLGDYYNSVGVKKTSAVISIIIYVASVGAEFYAFAKVMQSLGITDNYLLVSMTLLFIFSTVLYSSHSGFRGVVKTDYLQLLFTIAGSIAILITILIVIELQFAILILLLLLLLIFVFRFKKIPEKFSFIMLSIISLAFVSILLFASLEFNYISFQTGEVDKIYSNFLSGEQGIFGNASLIIGSILLFLTFLISSVDMWQRIAAIAPRNEANSAVKELIKGGTWFFPLIYVLPISLGILYFNQPDIIPGDNSILIEAILKNIYSLPIILKILLFSFSFTCLVAAMISTADTLLLTAVYVLMFDIKLPQNYSEVIEKHNTPELVQKKLILHSRLWLFVFGICSIFITILGILGISFDTIIWVFFSSVIVYSVPLIIPVWTEKFRGKSISAILSIAGGFTLEIGFLAFIYFYSQFLEKQQGIDVSIQFIQETQSLAPIVGFLGAIIFFFFGLLFHKKNKR